MALDISYVDSLQIHSPLFTEIPLVEVYKEIKKMVSAGKARYIGISNANLEQLTENCDRFTSPEEYNEKIDEMLLKYEMYKSSLLKYINSKSYEKIKIRRI